MLLRNKVERRLMPLYIAGFFEGFVLWYAIEKLFMTNIGFDPRSIALVVIVAGVTGLLLEVPFGILADRWSRKGVLILANVALILASLTLGLSETVLQYTIAYIFFGMYAAMFSGTVDSIVYDTLLEENGSRKGYEKYFGYRALIASVGLIASSFVGGFIAISLDLKATYLLTIPFTLVAIGILLFLKEPQIHKHQANIKVFKHIKETFSLVTKKGFIAWIIIALITSYILLEILYEMDQLWLIALGMPLYLYGPVNAIQLAGYGLGGPLASILVKKNIYIWVSCVIALGCAVLLGIQNLALVIIAIAVGVLLSEALYIVGMGKMHDAVPSKHRSGVSSAVSTFGKIAMLPVIFAFGAVADATDIFRASYMMIPLTLIVLISLFVALKPRSSPIYVKTIDP